MIEFWIIGGIVLIVLEAVIPGGVLSPLGAGAVVVGLLMWLGVIDTLVGALTAWFVLSLALILVFRAVFKRFTGSEESRGSTDEELEAFDEVVEVIETIEVGAKGRVAFRGSSWPATCYDRTVRAGEKAKLFYRDGLTWVVTPVEPGIAAGLDDRLARP